MKVVLLQHVKGLGQKGELKEVSPGYFRNMLAPRKMAAVATGSKVAEIKHQQIKATEKLAVMKESAAAIKKKLDGKSITIIEKASGTGHLYAAVSAKEIAETVKGELKVEIPAKAVDIKGVIKEPGDFDIRLDLHKEVSAQITLHVIGK